MSGELLMLRWRVDPIAQVVAPCCDALVQLVSQVQAGPAQVIPIGGLSGGLVSICIATSHIL